MKTPRWLPRVLLESGLIVFSVLLALGITEWQEERETAARVDVALENVRAELLANEREIEDAYGYHKALTDTLFALAAADVPEISGEVYPRGLILTTNVTSTAWQSAQATGVIAAMPYPTVLTLSRAYAEQSRYRRWKDGVMQSFYGFVLREGLEGINREYDRVAGLINDISSWERRLLEVYGSALQEVGPAVIEEAPFLSDAQKRDILYNNAARFLRLSEEEVARHHRR